VEKFINSRREVCRIYNSVFKDISQLKIPQTDFSNVSPFIYYVRVLNNMRGQLIDYLKSKRIDTGIHFIPVHTHTFYKHFRAGSMVMTEQIVQEVVTLPLHSHMKKEYLERIIREIVEFFR
jgi:dTDP-4-amino-4,6-dideoxygalactose transaminase